MRISKFILIIAANWVFSQDTAITVDGEKIPIYERSSIISQFDSILVGNGEFGGKLVLVEHESSSSVLFNYETHDERKTIDEILFQKETDVNTPVLQQMFSNLTQAHSVASAQTIVNELHTGYPFIPSDIHLNYGLMDNEKLGVLVDFNPAFNSHFSGIAGAGRQADQAWAVTGEIDIHLENTWRTANMTDLVWKRNGEESQYILFKHEEPYIYGLPFGTKVEFVQDLRNREYVYTNSNGAFALQFGRGGKWYFGGGKESIKPTAYGDSLGIESLKAQTFNMEYFSDGRNDRWLPTKGIFINLIYQIGLANENQSKENLTTRRHIFVEEYFSLTRRSVLRIKLWNSKVWTKDIDVHKGKMILYGGINTLRGYNEDVFRSEIINIISFDLFMKLTNNLQFFTFCDKSIPSVPLSFGLGIKQKSTNSFIEITFGWPVDEAFSGGKVHVKFTSLLD